MKVILSAGYAPSLLIFRRDLLAALRARGCDVLTLAPDSPGVADRLRERGVRFVSVPLQTTGFNPLADLRYQRALERIFRAENPDAILAYTHKAVVFGMAAAHRARVPVRAAMITGLGYAFTDVVGLRRRVAHHVLRLLYRRALRRTSVAVFQNPDDAALFRELRLTPPALDVRFVAGSGVNLDEFPTVPPSPGPVAFLMLARLLVDKGVREYVQAAAEIRAAHPEVEFHLAGGRDGNPTAIPLDEVRGWQEAGHVIYHGEVSDVRPLLAKTSVYVLPSYREGTPRSVLEAMSTGRAIITTDAPGCRETVLPGENGFLVPVKDAAALAACMRRFVAEPALAVRMGAASRRRAEAQFDVQRVNAELLDALQVK